MDMVEKAEQIKAMTEALSGTDSKQTEIMNAVSELLCELAGAVQGSIEQGEGGYEIECPNCGEPLTVMEEDVYAGEVTCPACDAVIKLDFGEDEDEDSESGYGMTCPECGCSFKADEEELLGGNARCPNCGAEQEL